MAQTLHDSEPTYDLQISFYGPGNLACWYLALLCVLITWFFHPSKNFSRLKIAPDLVFFALYACLSAGHMAAQIARFDADDIRQMNEEGAFTFYAPSFYSYYFSKSFHEWDMFRNLSPRQKEMVMGLNSSFQVAFTFHWVATCALLAVGYVKIKTAESRDRLKVRAKLLPWILVISELWVLGCFCYLAIRCGLKAVFHAVSGFSFPLVFLIVFSYVLIKQLCFSLWNIGSSLKSHSCGDWLSIIWSQSLLGWGKLLIEVSIGSMILLATIVGLYYTVTVCAFPEVGVTLSGLDQILSLFTGIIAVLFTTSSVLESRNMDWGDCWRDCWKAVGSMVINERMKKK